MQFVSPRFSLVTGLAPAMWQRTRAAVPLRTLWTALMVLLLADAIAGSTAAAVWVPGLDVLPRIALLGATALGILAVARPVRWPVALLVSVAAGAVAAGLAAGSALFAGHHTDPHDLRLVALWAGRVMDGSAFADTGFVLYLICWLIWSSAGWLAWWTLRRQAPLIGLIPGALIFVTNLLNYPTDQNGYVLGFLLVTLGLLLWTNYNRSVSAADVARIRLTGDARWDFWETGLVAMAALIVLGIMLPPLSTVDRTTQVESGLFTQWAEIQNRLSHPIPLGTARGAGGSTGFSADVSLGGAIRKTNDVVFTYKTVGNFAGPRYFRGVDEILTFQGQWRPVDNPPLKEALPHDKIPNFTEDYHSLALGTVDVNMLLPPSGYAGILFYPGRLYTVNRDSIVWSSESGGPNSQLVTIDRLISSRPPTSAGNYEATVEYSTATDDQLRAAGTEYPAFITPSYMSLPQSGYRSPQVEARIRRLAESITAGLQNPYDKASAIESYLRDPGHYTWTQTPPNTPPGEDPIFFFLFTSHQGYCEYFASAMGDLLRSIGIPTRLVNGFGPGTFDSNQNRFVVRGLDAHTWVEVYFPHYGWIVFEPTPDSVYFPVPRGTQGQDVCIREQGCTAPSGIGITGPDVSPSPRSKNLDDTEASASTGPGFLRLPDASTLTRIVGVTLAVILLLFAATVRYLRPRSVDAVWRRAGVLVRVAGAERKAGDTPLEMSRRLAWTFPEAKEPLRSLAEGFVIAAYAPPDEAPKARSSVFEAWSALRPLLLRRILQRIRPF